MSVSAAMLRQQQEDLQRDNIEFLLEWEEIGDDVTLCSDLARDSSHLHLSLAVFAT